jgi:MFS family permease
MGFNPAALFNPYFVALGGGFFVGIYFSLMLRFPKKQEKKQKLKKAQGRWGGILLILGPLLILLGALFFPTPDYLTVGWLILFGASILLWFFIFRFPKAIGIPAILIAGVLGYAVWVEIREWVRVEPSETLLTFRFIPSDEGGNIQIKTGNGPEVSFSQEILDQPLPLEVLNLPVWGELLGGTQWLRTAFTPSPAEDYFRLATYLRMLDYIETIELTWPRRAAWRDQYLWFRTGTYYWSDEGS